MEVSVRTSQSIRGARGSGGTVFHGEGAGGVTVLWGEQAREVSQGSVVRGEDHLGLFKKVQ